MLFWSPDQKPLGFFALGKLKRIEIASGLPTTICDVDLLPVIRTSSVR